MASGDRVLVDNLARLNAVPPRIPVFLRSFAMIKRRGGGGFLRKSPLFREPHSGHYTRRRDEPREACFVVFFLSLFFLLFLRRRRRCAAGPPRSCGSDCSRETDGAARSTNRAPAFAKRHLAPTRAQRCCRAERRRTFAETPDRRSSSRFYPHHPRRPNGGGSTCVLRLRSFVGVLTFDTGVLWQD